jgi:upstream activation factor subunit UAF30
MAPKKSERSEKSTEKVVDKADKSSSDKSPAKTTKKPVEKVADKADKTDKAVKTVEKSKKVEVVEYEKSKLAELIAAITNMDKEFKAIKNLIKLVQKENDKKEKILKKERDRKEKARLSPSGFAKPTDISTEMCDFLEIPHGTLMSRTEVTKNINNYVSKHNLKDLVNGRIIRPDATLKKLLRVSDEDEVTFFHMQRLLNPHIKPFKQAAPPAATTV